MKSINIASAIGEQISDRLSEEIGKIMGEKDLKKKISEVIEAQLSEKQAELQEMVNQAIGVKVEEAVKLGLNPPVVEEEVDGQTEEQGSQKKSFMAKDNSKEIKELRKKLEKLMDEGQDLLQETKKDHSLEEFEKIQDRIDEIGVEAGALSDRLFALMGQRASKESTTDFNAVMEEELPAKVENPISSRLFGKKVVVVGIDRDISKELKNKFAVASVGYKFNGDTEVVIYGNVRKSKLHRLAKSGFEVISYKDIV